MNGCLNTKNFSGFDCSTLAVLDHKQFSFASVLVILCVMSGVTRAASCVTCLTSDVTGATSGVTCVTSGVTCVVCVTSGVTCAASCVTCLTTGVTGATLGVTCVIFGVRHQVLLVQHQVLHVLHVRHHWALHVLRHTLCLYFSSYSMLSHNTMPCLHMSPE